MAAAEAGAGGALLGASCPAPIADFPQIVLAHGSGGRLTQQLLEGVFLPAFANPWLAARDDAARLAVGGGRLALTTDSFVVTPLFFPGGDIGDLAVNGTVNDLAMSGARPLYLTAAFILEEGLAAADLRRVVASMARAARAAGVSVVAGDTKVVNRGQADKLFITTSGVGILPEGPTPAADRARPGDVVLLSGTIGDHGMAILSQREGLEFEGGLVSDTAPLADLAAALGRAAPSGAIHCLRDPTRGGVGAALTEWAASSRCGFRLEAAAVPVRESVRGACEILGLDPLFVANEGKLLAIVASDAAAAALTALRAHPLGREAAAIGEVTAGPEGMVLMTTDVGGTRVVELPFGEQLPRIC